MSTTRVVNVRVAMCDVYVGRRVSPASKLTRYVYEPHRLDEPIWGNPFKVAEERNRSIAVSMYRDLMLLRLGLMSPQRIDGEIVRLHAKEPRDRTPEWWAERIRGLEGKALGCWCAPEACHGDVLVELVERLKREGGA